MVNEQLERLIAERIDAEGPLPFDVYMEMALYEPALGYYGINRKRSDWEGDFITSPQVDPAYGELWAEGVRQLWAAAGRPPTFDIVEVGPGEGGFTSSLQACLGSLGPFRYTLVEPIPSLMARQMKLLGSRPDVTWVDGVGSLPPIDHGVIFANEILDNLPVALLEASPTGPCELYVGTSGSGLAWQRLPARRETVACMRSARLTPAEDGRVEVPLRAGAFVKTLLDSIAVGAVILIDYGAEGPELSERREGTLVCYSEAGMDDDPLQQPGTKDITAHANWTLVRRAIESGGCVAAGPLPQRTILRTLGSASVDARLRAEHESALAAGRGADAVRTLSRRQALGALLAPGGMGSFGVMAGMKDLATPAFLARVSERAEQTPGPSLE